MLSMDFNQRGIIDSTAVDWVASPRAGSGENHSPGKRLNRDMPPAPYAMILAS